jgi:hypothetical protein
MGRMRPRRSEEELEGIAEEVQYEIDMMRHAARLYHGQPNRIGLHRTFYLELFLLHLRNLHHFLYSTSENNDDVLAEDLIAPADWPLKGAPPGPTIDKEIKRKRYNRALAHLSYSRLDYNKRGKGWIVRRMHREIEDSLAAFFNAVPPERMKWFKSKYGPTHPP